MTIDEFNARFAPCWRLEWVNGPGRFFSRNGKVVIGLPGPYLILHGPTSEGEPIPFSFHIANPDRSTPLPRELLQVFHDGISDAERLKFLQPKQVKPYVSPPPNPKHAHRPLEISILKPEEEEDVCPTPKIRVAFSLTSAMRAAMTINGRLNIASYWFVLKLDDVALTEHIEMLMTMIHPPRHVELLYRAERPLAAGQHRLSITFPQGPGEQRTYTWKFQVDPTLTCEPKSQSRLGSQGGRIAGGSRPPPPLS